MGADISKTFVESLKKELGEKTYDYWMLQTSVGVGVLRIHKRKHRNRHYGVSVIVHPELPDYIEVAKLKDGKLHSNDGDPFTTIEKFHKTNQFKELCDHIKENVK